MKKRWIVFTPTWQPAPMSYWVHIEKDAAKAWHEATEFEPPLPMPIGAKGWPRYIVEIDDCRLEFASLHELAECVRVLSLRPLPTTKRLAAQRSGTAGPNSHWLSRLPARIKSGQNRARVLKFLQESLENFGQG